MIFFIITFIASLIIYLLAPQSYEEYYCILCTLLFLLTAVVFVKKTVLNRNYINFHVIFLLGNFFVDFAYPTFIYPIDPYFFNVFSAYPVLEQYICQGTGLCLLAMNTYMLGAFFYFSKHERKIPEDVILSMPIKYSSILVLKILSIIIVLLSIMLMAKNIGSSYGDSEINSQSVFLTTLIIPITLVFISYNQRLFLKNKMSFFFKVNIIPLSLCILYSFVSIIIGSRFSVIQLIIVLVGVTSLYVSRLKIKNIILLGFVGFFFMSYIQMRRSSFDNNEVSINKMIEGKAGQSDNISPLWNNALDLIINTRNIYKGLEYTEKYGYNYGKQIFFLRLWSPVPFMPSLMCNLFLNTTPVELSSQQILTNFTREDSPGLDFELGSNVVIDSYMEFGTIGVIFIFYFFGFFIQYLDVNKYRNIYVQTIYFIMLSCSLFMVRSGIFDQFRIIVWTIIIIWFVLKIRDNIHMKSIFNENDY